MERKVIQILSISLFAVTVLWGLWTLLYYLGVPVHSAVLLPEDTVRSLDAVCGSGALICRGAYGLLHAVWHSLVRAPFLVWYAVISALLYAGILGWRYVRTMRLDSDIVLRPWKILALFFAALWLLFTLLAYSDNGDMPFRRIIEPVPQVYQGAGPQAIAALRENYDGLKERGCLQHIGMFSGLAEASEIRFHCFQLTFFTRIVPPLLFVLAFLFELLVLGRFLLRSLLRLRSMGRLEEAVLSAGAGACGFIALFWLLAVLHVFIAPVGWAVLLILPALLWRHSLYWWRVFLQEEWTVSARWRSPALLIGWFLMSYLALNFLNVVRPFPIGWDDLGSYLNRPRQLVSYGHFLFSMSPFQWEYLTATGFLLFGFDSTFGATSSMFVNWSAGFLAVMSVLLFARSFFGRGGVLSASLYYALPLVGHFSFADMKIDNAVFLGGTLAAYALWRALFTQEAPEAREQRRLVLLAGMFAGFAFGMKVTAIMVFVALGSVLLGAVLHPLGFAAGVLAVCALFIHGGTLNMAGILERVGYDPQAVAPLTAAAVCMGVALLLFAAACALKKNAVKNTLILTTLLVSGFLAAVVPWLAHNSYQQGRWTGIAFGAPNTITPIIDPHGTNPAADYILPPELATDPKHPTCKPTGATEELGRYWGNRKGWEHYLTLPFRNVMNIDSAGYYVTTMPALLLFPVLLLLPYFWRREGRWLRWMWFFTAFLVAQWSFLANGIPWYGIGMFLGLVLCLEALLLRAPDVLNRSLAGFFITVSLIFCLGQRLWQFESQRNLFEYPLGKVSASALRERTIPYYDDITAIAQDRAKTVPGRPLMYRVGTFMPYFIPHNLEVIGISDHQLDFFTCLRQEGDAATVLARLKALGFNSIVFDTNTATIERDLNGSLHKKVQAFADFINDPAVSLQIVINDPGAGIAYILLP